MSQRPLRCISLVAVFGIKVTVAHPSYHSPWANPQFLREGKDLLTTSSTNEHQ